VTQRILIRPTLLALLVSLLLLPAQAQQINGVVSDMEQRQPLAEAFIENIHTGHIIMTDSVGQFSIAVEKGHVVEFRKAGYKTERVRIPEGIVPPFFKVFLEKNPMLIPGTLAQERGLDWKKDSLHYYETYKHILNIPQFSTLDMIQHPFSALSKRNRQAWAFQREYNWFEQEKYIDYVFNERIVGNLTGLQGDSVQGYLKMFRPTYQQLRQMREYDFFTYIRKTVSFYRSGYNPRRPVIRGGE
jgi:hypothetical protein